MDFKKGDIVVITGLKQIGSTNCQVLADLYDIVHVGSHDLLVSSRGRYPGEPFKISKRRCINVNEHAKKATLETNISPSPKHGSLVLGFDTEYNGAIKNLVIGHVAEIIHNTNSRTYYMVDYDNKQIMFEESKVLLLE